MNRKIFKNIGANEFFEQKENKFLLKFTNKTSGLEENKLEFDEPCVIISNHTSSLDKAFLSKIIASPCVFLKQEILEEILLKQLSINNFKRLLKCFNELKKENYSIVIFNDFGISPFGETTPISTELSDFVMNLKLNIRFVNLYGSFFNFPVWAESKRKCIVKFIAKNRLTFETLKAKTSKEVNELMNSFSAFSATNQVYVFNLIIDFPNRAEFVDRIAYACPKCKSLFSVYSEYSCLKCSNCGSAIEFSVNGDISLSKEVKNFEQLKENLYNTLKNFDFTINPLKTYKNCLILRNVGEKKARFEKCELTIYAQNLVLNETIKDGEEIKCKKTTIAIKNLQKIAYIGQNTVKIWQKNKEPIILKGKGRENFYIIFDLMKVNNGETK